MVNSHSGGTVRKVFILSLAMTIVAISANASFARLKPATHKGFFISLGFGPGSLGVSPDTTNKNLDRSSGGAGNFRIGWALRQNLLIGIEANAWVKEVVSDVSVTFSNTSAAITWYPKEQIFIKAGPAVGNSSVDLRHGHARYTYTSDTGAGGMIGAGAEFRVSRLFAVIPSIQWTFQKFNDFKSNVFSFTLGGGFLW